MNGQQLRKKSETKPLEVIQSDTASGPISVKIRIKKLADCAGVAVLKQNDTLGGERGWRGGCRAPSFFC